MVEIKGFTFAERLTSGYDKIKENAEDQIMDQAARQVQASGGRAHHLDFRGKGGSANRAEAL